MRWSVLVWLCATACASPVTPATAPPAPGAGSEPHDDVPDETENENDYKDDDDDDLPAVCQSTPRPLDRFGLGMLRLLQADVVAQALDPAVPDRPLFNLGDVRHSLRGNPGAELVFVFPLSVRLPTTVFAARTARSTSGLDRAPRMVIYVELSEATQLQLGDQRALMLRFGAGPTGTPPSGVSWLWGLWAQHCVVLEPDGHWSSHPVGVVIMS